MDWNTTWQLAGEICDILGNTTARQHEQIANLLQDRDGQAFCTHRQRWYYVNPDDAMLLKLAKRLIVEWNNHTRYFRDYDSRAEIALQSALFRMAKLDPLSDDPVCADSLTVEWIQDYTTVPLDEKLHHSVRALIEDMYRQTHC